MSQILRKAFSEELGLLDGPREVLGKLFIFGDGDHIISGAIRTIGYSPKEGLILYVTPPRYRGIDIQKMMRIDGQWCAVSKENEIRPGNFCWL